MRRMLSLMSKSVFASRTPRVFRLLRESRSFVSFVRRSVSVRTTPRYFSCSSGGIVPSSIAERKPWIDVSGERKSWETFAMNFFWSSSARAISLAI